MKFYTSNPRLELPEKELQALLDELIAHGFGHKLRTPDHAKKYPVMDELAYMIEAELGLVVPQI